jgi:hypothetical protein
MRTEKRPDRKFPIAYPIAGAPRAIPLHNGDSPKMLVATKDAPPSKAKNAPELKAEHST